ncbi:hypothetical protein L4174_023570 [Photobacterium sp. CCB-ST2H9]|uniref:hypothetical protein n=1 Tax=Photobacterium sp. CCB-ST2H9 TaxID=2912855 RepID=UPI00200523B9|nr:hypothetical protein [Photobacterium sp. CCB-ST2H9]UTM59674.1 hypothetical protein L4174_023570 [Photobacterium sp. CCB-ST2H9]
MRNNHTFSGFTNIIFGFPKKCSHALTGTFSSEVRNRIYRCFGSFSCQRVKLNKFVYLLKNTTQLLFDLLGTFKGRAGMRVLRNLKMFEKDLLSNHF